MKTVKTSTLPLESKTQYLQSPLFILGSASGKRVRLMQAARAAMGLPPAHVIEWRNWLDVPDCLDKFFDHAIQSSSSQCSVLKIEPPGDDADVQHRLINSGCALLGRAPLAAAEYGELQAGDAWFAGFADIMRKLEQVLLRHSGVKVVNAPAEILLMTDKLACQEHLVRNGIAIPQLFGTVTGYDHLRAMMAQHGVKRIFLKVRYGSSASGVLAYRMADDGREQAITTAQLERGPHGVKIFNVKKVRQYNRHDEIVELIDLLAGQEAYAERWLQKPRTSGGHFDVRMVTLGGTPAHRVARIGRRAMTNLHLDNQRGNLAGMLDPVDIHQLEQIVEQAAATFPASHVIGFDVVPGRESAQVLEVNAFGELLPGLLWRDQDSYAAQLEALAA